jgi:hypothetical protein
MVCFAVAATEAPDPLDPPELQAAAPVASATAVMPNAAACQRDRLFLAI